DFPLRPADLSAMNENSLATQRQVTGLALGRSLTLFLLLLILTSGAVVAIDSLAGEKERGTLETVLTTAVKRTELLTAKGLVILAIALLISLVQPLNLLIYARLKLFSLPASLATAVPPWIAVLLFLLFLPVAALAAGTLLLISGYARSYKEAQLYFLPTLLVGLLPALAPLLPGVKLRSILALAPVSIIAIATKEI